MRSFFQRDSQPSAKAPSPKPAGPAPAAPTPSRGSGRETTRIARGSTVVGEISGTAELVIEGKVEGEIDLKNRVVVGHRGVVEGKIVGAAVEVGGRVVGNVHGLERVQVLESGRLEGDVTSPRVIIAEGAFFKGKVEMSSGTTGKNDTGKNDTDKKNADKQDRTPPAGMPSRLEKTPSPSPGYATAGAPSTKGQPGKANP